MGIKGWVQRAAEVGTTVLEMPTLSFPSVLNTV